MWMESTLSPACAYPDSQAAIVNMISMSVTPSHASMEALVLTVMGPTNAPVLMATQGSIVRILCAGVTLLPAKMEARVGSKVHPTPASVRLDGLASTVTSQVFPVRWQLNSKVLTWLTYAGIQASVWMLETRIIAAAKLATLAVTARNRWTSAHPTLAKMEPPALII